MATEHDADTSVLILGHDLIALLFTFKRTNLLLKCECCHCLTLVGHTYWNGGQFCALVSLTLNGYRTWCWYLFPHHRPRFIHTDFHFKRTFLLLRCECCHCLTLGRQKHWRSGQFGALVSLSLNGYRTCYYSSSPYFSRHWFQLLLAETSFPSKGGEGSHWEDGIEGSNIRLRLD